MCLSAIVIILGDFKVEASSGGGGEGENNNSFLNYSYIWEQIKEFCNVTYKAYDEGDIPKGRSFGSKGGYYTVNYILKLQMENIIGLEDVHTEQIGHINGSKKNYTSIINMTDFNLKINNGSANPYNYSNPVPKNEMYVIPSGYPSKDYNNLTHNYTLNNTSIIKNNITHITGLWPGGGTFNDYFLTVTSSEHLNDIISLIVGNVTYIAQGETVPSADEQYGRIFLLDDEEYGQDQLDNITRANGCILVENATRDYNLVDTSQCIFTVSSVNNSDGNSIKELLENYSTVIVDNATGNLTFTYNLGEGWWPSTNHVYIDRIPDHFELANITWGEGPLIKLIAKMSGRDKPTFADYMGCYNFKSVWWREANEKHKSEQCEGVILYDSYDYHFMINPFNYWKSDPPTDLGLVEEWKEKSRRGPGLPVFTLNFTIGNWLKNNKCCSTLDGYADQVLTIETNSTPGLEAYNVVGNITIDKSPDDAIAIISNRYDGMWGQTPCDSGVGGGIVLGIAKYMKENNIIPKYNLTFLFTTGEEYIYRGAYHYNDSHPYYYTQPHKSNIIYWLILDQLCFNQSDVPMNIYFKEENHFDKIWAIVNQTQYESRTDYQINPERGDGGGSEQEVPSSRSNCNSFCLVKSDGVYNWDQWHRTGQNYTEGDSLKNIDRNDVNITAELAWNITKYFFIDPDCWFDNTDINVIDSDDADNLVDTISFSLDVTSNLPQDFAMVNYSLTKAITNDVVMFDNINFTVNRSAKSKAVNITLPSGESPGFYVFRNELFNSTGRIHETIDPVNDSSNHTYASGFYFLYPYNNNVTPPDITKVSATPDPVGYAYNVTISADVSSNMSSIDKVTVNITYPDETTTNSYNMTNTTGVTYQYIFNDTWQHGQYDYVIWAKDVNGNESGSSQYSFNVTINATISVCTIKDSYGNNTIVNITDPPCNPPFLGYELLDDGQVLRIWNRFDSYYFNTDNGVQFTNHYDEYWSHNVLMLGYYNDDEWNLIYRVDNLSGFNQDIETDDTTYVNATLWKNLNYKGYDFRLAIRYHLGVDDNELTVIPHIKNIDDEDIPYNLGFAWEIRDIQINMTTSGDFIEINGTTYFLNETLDETYKNMEIPCYYIREDINGEESESLYLRWDENLTVIVQVKSRDGQYNSPVTLGIKIGTLNVDQEKQTKMFWHDAAEKIYYFNSYETAEAWATNPGNMVDGSTSNYASTGIDEDIELCDDNNCSGSDLGTISKVELRVYGYYSTNQRDIILIPVFDGIVEGLAYNHPTESTANWSQWFDITNDPGLPPSGWTWNVVKDLDCKVTTDNGFGAFTLYCSKVEMRITYTPNNYPVISDPVPANGTTGVTISPMLNITVSDPDGDTMNITWLSNSSGSWIAFGTNSSVGNGTYHQIMSNASVNGEWWYWKVNVSDGTVYTESSVYNFFTGYQSKITNTGSTSFKGYLLMQVQFYNETSQSWVVVDDTVNESSPRAILWNDPGGSPGQHILALDTIFNGNVNTSDLSGFGNGTYRIYAAFRDPEGNILECDDETELVATYEFEITF